MAQFNISRGRFEQRDYERLKALLQKSLNEYDKDTGWIANPGTGTVEINLPRVPRFVLVQESDNADGDGWNNIAVNSASKTNVTFTSTKAYIRILAEI